MDFQVDLDVFRGPLDLLLYLVRKHEVEIVDIPIAAITEQYLEYIEVLQQLDVGSAGDFLEMASTLVEIKSRMVLPRGGEVEDALADPRQELVERLLEYKKFKDAASMLDERCRDWQQRFGRATDEVDRRPLDPGEQELQEVELWDLVSAFGRLMRDSEAAKPASIVYDDTPIHVYMDRIKTTLTERGRVSFRELFEPGAHKSSLVGIFLAVLELVRHRVARAEQDRLFGDIWVTSGPDPTAPLDPKAVDNYEHGQG